MRAGRYSRRREEEEVEMLGGEGGREGGREK